MCDYRIQNQAALKAIYLAIADTWTQFCEKNQRGPDNTFEELLGYYDQNQNYSPGYLVLLDKALYKSFISSMVTGYEAVILFSIPY